MTKASQNGLTRRDFVRAAAASTLAAPATLLVASPGHGTTEPQQPPRGRHLPRSAIGLQYFTIRTPLAEDFAGTWAVVADIGYRNIEMGPSLFGNTPTQMRQLADDLGLTIVSRQVPLSTIRSNFGAVLDEAVVLGQHYIRCPSIPGGLRTVAGYQQVAADFNVAGAAARDAGFRFGYHNHAYDFDTVDGVVLLDVLLAETDPHLVDLQLDIGWAAFAGVDVVEFMAANPRRVGTFHVKDINADGSQTDVGAGIVDFAAIFDAAYPHGVREYIVEHDNPADPLATAEASYRYLSQLTF